MTISIISIAWALFGAALGFMIWDLPQYFLPLLFLIPIIILNIESKYSRLQFALGYWMAASWPVAAATKGFFHQDALLPGVLMLSVASLAHCLPFLWVKPLSSPLSLRDRITNTLILLIGVVPPLGFFAWVHPFYALGIPDNFYSLVLVVALLFLAFNLTKVSSKIVVSMAIVLFAYTQQYPVSHVNPQSPEHVAISTQWSGPAPSMNTQPQLARFLDILSDHNMRSGAGARISVYPENILGVVDRDTLQAYSSLMPVLSGRLLLGVSLLDNAELTNALVDPYSELVITARVPMPVGSWRPWDAQNHHRSDIIKTNVFNMNGTPILFLFCAEEYMPFIWLSGLIERPQAIISVSNSWWAGPQSGVAQRQSLHAALLSRMVGLPIYRAVNE